MTKTILIILLLLPSFGYAGMYSWTDENGVRHFSNTPPEKSTPAIQRTEEYVSQDNEDSDLHQKNGRRKKSSEKTKTEDKIKPDRKQNKSKKVIIYTTPTCGYCNRARALLNKHGIKYTEYDIKASKDAYKKFLSLNGRGVPLIFIGDKRIAGFNKAAIKGALGIP